MGELEQALGGSSPISPILEPPMTTPLSLLSGGDAGVNRDPDDIRGRIRGLRDDDH